MNIEEYKEKNGVTPLDLVNPKSPRSTAELKKERMAICNACPKLIKLTTQCKECHCIMYLKTTLEEAKCPIGKW